MTNCLRCGRPLKNKTSISRGYGPGCYKKIQADTKNDYETEEERVDSEERIEIEGQMDILEESRKIS